MLKSSRWDWVGLEISERTEVLISGKMEMLRADVMSWSNACKTIGLFDHQDCCAIRIYWLSKLSKQSYFYINLDQIKKHCTCWTISTFFRSNMGTKSTRQFVRENKYHKLATIYYLLFMAQKESGCQWKNWLSFWRNWWNLRQLPREVFSSQSSTFSFTKCQMSNVGRKFFLKWSNSARKSIQIFWDYSIRSFASWFFYSSYFG